MDGKNGRVWAADRRCVHAHARTHTRTRPVMDWYHWQPNWSWRQWFIKRNGACNMLCGCQVGPRPGRENGDGKEERARVLSGARRVWRRDEKSGGDGIGRWKKLSTPCTPHHYPMRVYTHTHARALAFPRPTTAIVYHRFRDQNTHTQCTYTACMCFENTLTSRFARFSTSPSIPAAHPIE